jgi:hypothetical protein
MSVFSKLRGTIETIFQLGLDGPNLKNNAGVIEARNSGDGAYAIVRGASPVGNNDLANKTYVDTLASRTVVSDQFDGNNALPANTGVEHFKVVTTTGPNATIGQLIWDDGTGVGTAVVLAASDGRLIITTQAFTGGTVSLKAESLYAWDAGGAAWVNAGGSATSGGVRVIRYAVTNAAVQDSASKIPANAIVLRCRLNVTVPYSGGTSITIGRVGSLTLLQVASDNRPTVANIYEVPQETDWGAAELVVRTSIAGAPAAGAGWVLVEYSVPDA